MGLLECQKISTEEISMSSEYTPTVVPELSIKKPTLNDEEERKLWDVIVAGQFGGLVAAVTQDSLKNGKSDTEIMLILSVLATMSCKLADRIIETRRVRTEKKAEVSLLV